MKDLLEFMNRDMRPMLWDGRVINMPFLFGIVKYVEGGFKSQELAEIINNDIKYINT